MSLRPEDVIVEALQTCHGKDPDYDDGVDARAILAALHTAGFIVEQGWQSESTAPIHNAAPILLLHRDGRIIIPDCFTVARHPENPPGQRFVGYWLHHGTVYSRNQFTDWRPLTLSFLNNPQPS
jgi:hypothetical protein